MKKIYIFIFMFSFSMSVFGQYSQIQKLTPNNPQTEEEFGNYLFLNGNDLFVGAYYYDSQGSNDGAVYYFTKNSSSWTQVQLLTAGDDAMPNDHFGSYIARYQNYLLISANADDTNGYYEVGSVYFFEFNGTQWEKRQKFVYDNLNNDDMFGWALDIYDTIAVIGAPGYLSYKGAVFVYKFDGSQWNFDTLLQSSDISFNDEFGGSVAFDGENLVVGAPGKNSSTGSAYIFHFEDNDCTQTAILNASDASSNDRFGVSVDIDGNAVVVGANLKNSYTGAAYVFEKQASVWEQTAKLTASDATSSDYFGQVVAIEDSKIVIGAWSKNNMTGAAYIFEKNSTWSQLQKITASDASSNDRFGYSVDISNGNICVGAHYDSDNVSYGGSVYMFSPPPPQIIQQPENAEVCEGGQAQFSIVAQNVTSYQWRKNGVNISDNGNISGSTTASLVINEVDLSDAANYDCVLSNSSGTVVSQSAILYVDENITAYAGQDTVVCIESVSLNAIQPDIGSGQWSLVAGTGDIDDPSSPETNVSMLMPGVSVFRWTVTNGVCQDFDDVTIENQGVFITQNPSDVQADEGDTVFFEVAILGQGAFQWYKDNSIIQNAIDSILIIENVTEGDAGTYLCKIKPNSQCPEISAIPAMLTVSPGSFVGSENITFYPNPVSEQLVIDLPYAGEYKVWIISTDGKILYEAIQNTDKLVLDFPFKNGIYFVKLKNEKFSASFKILK